MSVALTSCVDSRMPEEYELPRSGTVREAADVDNDISKLEHKLAGFDFAWDGVARSCDDLKEWLNLAHLTQTVCVASGLGMH